MTDDEPNQAKIGTGEGGWLGLAQAFGDTPEEAEGNARLITAAPELLAALEKILYAHDTGNCGASMGEASLCPAYAEMARAAINKAKGSKDNARR